MALVRKKEPEPPPPYIPKYDVKIGRTNIIHLKKKIICCIPKESCPLLYFNYNFNLLFKLGQDFLDIRSEVRLQKGRIPLDQDFLLELCKEEYAFLT